MKKEPVDVTKLIRTYVDSFVHQQPLVYPKRVPMRFRFRCYRCKKIFPLSAMFHLANNKTACPACTQKRLRRRLQLEDLKQAGVFVLDQWKDMRMFTLGAELKLARILRSWSQQDLADCVGVSRVTINLWEQGRRYPNQEHGKFLTEFLRIVPEMIPLSRSAIATVKMFTKL